MYGTLQKAPLINHPLHTGHAPAWVVTKNGYDIYVVNYYAPSGLKVGRAITCINPDNWTICATLRKNELLRPIDVRYNPIDGYLYVLDFGKFEIKEDHSINAEPQSGKLWRLVPS